MRPAEVADLLGKPRDNIKYLMWRMGQAGTIATQGDGTYTDTTNRPHAPSDTNRTHPTHRPGSHRVSAVRDPSPPPLTIVHPVQSPDVNAMPDTTRAMSAVSGMGVPPGACARPLASPRRFASEEASWRQPDLFPGCVQRFDTEAELN